MTSFWWIRHAPVIGNNECCYGNNEVECDISDINSFKKLSEKLPSYTKVFTSNLSRTIKTLNATSKQGYKYNIHIKDNRIEEQNLGDYTGMKYYELYSLAKKLNISDDNWLLKSSHVPPGGESFLNLMSRVIDFIEEMLISNKNKNLVIFSHGGPIRAAISYAINYQNREIIPVDIDNTKITLIEYNNKKEAKLKLLNN